VLNIVEEEKLLAEQRNKQLARKTNEKLKKSGSVTFPLEDSMSITKIMQSFFLDE